MDQGALLNRMTNRIRQSLELPQVLSATVTEMRSFLKMDRVKVYRFLPDGTGQVIAESVDQERLPSLAGLHFPAAYAMRGEQQKLLAISRADGFLAKPITDYESLLQLIAQLHEAQRQQTISQASSL
jgi:GAF domain-containing protein